MSSGGAVPRVAGVTMASKLANSSSKPSINRGTLSSARWYANAVISRPRASWSRSDSLSWSRPFSYSRSRLAAISASMIVRCQSQASRQRLGQRVFLALRAERRRQLVEGFARGFVGALPDRRLHERHTRRQRRLAGQRLHERNARARARVGIVLVEAGELLGGQRDVVERAREHAHAVERARQLEDAVARDQPVRRLEAVDAAERRRPDDRRVGLRADRQRHHAGRHRGRRARRRAAGRARRRRAGCASCRARRWRTRWSRSCRGSPRRPRAAAPPPRHRDRAGGRRAARCRPRSACRWCR